MISLSDYIEKFGDYQVLITSMHAPEMAEQLMGKGVSSFSVYMYRHKQYFPQDELLINDYEKVDDYFYGGFCCSYSVDGFVL